jgi:hypothetical protein
MADPRVAAELERARVPSAYAVLGRVLLAGRDEVMRYATLEARVDKAGGPLVPHPEATGALPCEPPSCVRKPAPLNTDDNALIELAAPRDLIGFERYKGYLGSVYGPEWPYGRIAGRLQGIGQGEVADAHRAGIALALLEHGRKREAAAVLQAAGNASASAELAAARGVLALLSGATAEPALTWTELAADPTLRERTNTRLREGTAEVVDWLERGEPKRAHQAAQALPDSLMRHVGTDALLLRAVAAYRAGELSAVITDLEGLIRAQPDLPRTRPEALFYLARAHYALQHFGKGVSWAERWLIAASPSPTVP